MATETLCFRITGEYLTEQARTFVLEGEWRKGLALLESAFGDGMTAGDRFALLQGEKKLVGVNEVDLADENPEVGEAYREEVAGLYTGLIRASRPNGRRVYMRPYAYVDNWGASDMWAAMADNVYTANPYRRKSIGIPQVTSEARSVRYMDDRTYDRAVHVSCKAFGDMLGDWQSVIGLWKEEGADPPPWVKIPDGDRSPTCSLVSPKGKANPSWAASMLAAVEAGWFIEHRGSRWLYDNNPEIEAREKARYDKSPLPQFQNKPNPEEPLVPDKASNAKLLINLGVDPLLAVKMAAGVEELPAGPAIAGEPRVATEAWVTPDGRFWPCRYMQHTMLAEKLLRQLRGEEHEGGKADSRARELSWVKITYSAINDRPEICEHGSRVTPEQVLTARLWCEAHGHAESDFPFFERAKERLDG
jgi:hypothetical protein